MLRVTREGSEQAQSSSSSGCSFSKKRTLSRASAYALVKLNKHGYVWGGWGWVGVEDEVLVHVSTCYLCMYKHKNKCTTHIKLTQHLKRNMVILGQVTLGSEQCQNFTQRSVSTAATYKGCRRIP